MRIQGGAPFPALKMPMFDAHVCLVIVAGGGTKHWYALSPTALAISNPYGTHVALQPAPISHHKTHPQPGVFLFPPCVLQSTITHICISMILLRILQQTCIYVFSFRSTSTHKSKWVRRYWWSKLHNLVKLVTIVKCHLCNKLWPSISPYSFRSVWADWCKISTSTHTLTCLKHSTEAGTNLPCTNNYKYEAGKGPVGNRGPPL